jgi:hypothetical protein
MVPGLLVGLVGLVKAIKDMHGRLSIFDATVVPEADIVIREGVIDADSLFLSARGFNLKQADFTLLQIDRDRVTKRLRATLRLALHRGWDTLLGRGRVFERRSVIRWDQ